MCGIRQVCQQTRCLLSATTAAAHLISAAPEPPLPRTPQACRPPRLQPSRPPPAVPTPLPTSRRTLAPPWPTSWPPRPPRTSARLRLPAAPSLLHWGFASLLCCRSMRWLAGLQVRRANILPFLSRCCRVVVVGRSTCPFCIEVTRTLGDMGLAFPYFLTDKLAAGTQVRRGACRAGLLRRAGRDSASTRLLACLLLLRLLQPTEPAPLPVSPPCPSNCSCTRS